MVSVPQTHRTVPSVVDYVFCMPSTAMAKVRWLLCLEEQPRPVGYQFTLAGVSNPWPEGCPLPRMAMSAAQNKIVNLLKTFFFRSSVFISICVFSVQPKTTLLLPVWPRDTKKKVGCPSESKAFHAVDAE